MSSILTKLNTVAFAAESLVRQGLEVKKSGNLDLLETIRFVNDLRERLFCHLKCDKKDLQAVLNDEVYNEARDLEVQSFLDSQILTRLIKNQKDVLDYRSFDNLREIRELIKNGEKILFIANHLSELDPAVFDFLLRKNDLESISDQMTVMIGGEVQMNQFKNFWAKSLNRTYVFSESNMNNPIYQDFYQEMGVFNLKSIKNLGEKIKNGSLSSIFVHPSGKRCRPNLKKDGKYIEDFWNGDKIAKLGRILGMDKIVPVAIFGTENMHGPKSEQSGDDDSYISGANIFYRVGDPVDFKSFKRDLSDEDLRQILLPLVNKLTKNPLTMYQVGLPQEKKMFFTKE